MEEGTPHTQTPRRNGRPILLALLVLALLPLGGVLIHALVPPPMTLLMAQRSLGGQGLSYRWRSLDDISPGLVSAVIAAEDARFCSHRGFDLQAIEDALKANEQG
ncbi:MAG: hypothetical protein B7Z42_13290, partial [Brevundimonas sp. 12-68-7]